MPEFDWLGTAISLWKQYDGKHETVFIEASGVSPNSVAEDHSVRTGQDWFVGDYWNEDDHGVIVLHRKKDTEE